jgi:hypothetical protein
MNKNNSEGVIKFQLIHEMSNAIPWHYCVELDIWRTVLFQLGLTGTDPKRYGGLAFGNVSCRLEGQSFLVSGTQTGSLKKLRPDDYCIVEKIDIDHNRLVSRGPIKPSSEALTHGAVYAFGHTGIQCVLHVHSPEIWNHREWFGIPSTSSEVAYGTQEMALAVAKLSHDHPNSLIALGGHEDGILALGKTVEEAAITIIRQFGLTLQTISTLN